MSRRDDHTNIGYMLSYAGEAANRVSETTQVRHLEIPWCRIVGMRSQLIHGYDVTDIDILWDTITSDLPPLIEKLNELTD